VPELNAIIGQASKSGTIGLVTVVATDPHGSYANFFLTIKVKNYKPLIRKRGKFP
jgi:hypothetical protein